MRITTVDPDRSSPKRFAATETPAISRQGIEAFERWVSVLLQAPPALEEPHIKIAPDGPRDLSRLIEIVRDAEMFCVRRHRELSRRMRTERQRIAGANEWERMMQLIVMAGESKWWSGKVDWLRDTRMYLEDELQRHEETGTRTR